MPDPIYIDARRGLLDALEALGPHRSAVILVGAQAIYLHTGEADLAVAPLTTDADLALDPRMLAPEPLLEPMLRAAGLTLCGLLALVTACTGTTPEQPTPSVSANKSPVEPLRRRRVRAPGVRSFVPGPAAPAGIAARGLATGGRRAARRRCGVACGRP